MWEKHLAECLVHGWSLINVTPSTCHPFAVRFKSDNCIITCKLQSTYILREKEMATHSSILAWRIPWTKEPGGLQSMGWQSRTWLKRLHTHTQDYRKNSLSHLFCTDYATSPVLSTLLIWDCLIFLTMLWDKCYYYFHFTVVRSEAQINFSNREL